MIKRKVHVLKGASVIEVEEYPEVGHKDKRVRRAKSKRSSDSQARINQIRREDKVRRKMIQYFDMSDFFITLTYAVENRPEDMESAMADWKKFYNELARHYRRKKVTFRWVKNLERGTKGAWHIHMVLKDVEGLLEKIEKLWTKGFINYCRIGKNPAYAEVHFRKLAAYLTKSTVVTVKKKDGSYEKPRVKESNCTWSKNMPIPDPEVRPIKKWSKEPWVRKGYVIIPDTRYEGKDMFGFTVRRYTMLRI